MTITNGYAPDAARPHLVSRLKEAMEVIRFPIAHL